jgi:hypothetical protein
MLGDSDEFLCDDLTELEAAAGFDLTPYPEVGAMLDGPYADDSLDDPDRHPDPNLSDDAGSWEPASPGWGYRLTLLVAAVIGIAVAVWFFGKT